MKTVGIIGGLGPETTANFYQEVVFSCSKITNNRPPILISNVPLPLKIEEELITKAKGEKRILPFLISAAKQLEKAGADFIVIPCNTVHIFIQEIRKSVDIPVLSIIEETANFLKEKKVKKVGLLGTTLTIQNKLFDEKLKSNGTKIITPEDSSQKKISTIINNLVNNLQKNDKPELAKIMDELVAKGSDCLLLACTDIQLLNPKHSKAVVFDTMNILAKATVKQILS